MSTTTTNLGLFKYDLATDAKSAFNITNSLNNNWDILDREISGKISTLTPAGSVTNPVYVNSSGKITACSGNVGNSIKPVYISNGKFTACTSSLDIIKDSTLSTNGYIKFNNGLIFAWTHKNIQSTSTNYRHEYPTSFNTVFLIVANLEDKEAEVGKLTGASQEGATSRATVITSYSNTELILRAGQKHTGNYEAKVHFLIIGK